MQYLDLIEKLTHQLQFLPGKEAHRKMAPFRATDENFIPRKNAKLSATMLLLYPKENELFSVLIQRTASKGVHSAQIALPGGKKDQDDLHLEHTAHRETLEEIGVPKIQTIGQLTEVYIEPSNFLVFPYIGFVQHVPSFKLQTEEVDELIEYPISLLQNESIVQKSKMKTALYGTFDVPIFNINDKKVWGATAAILSEFKEVMKNI